METVGLMLLGVVLGALLGAAVVWTLLQQRAAASGRSAEDEVRRVTEELTARAALEARTAAEEAERRAEGAVARAVELAVEQTRALAAAHQEAALAQVRREGVEARADVEQRLSAAQASVDALRAALAQAREEQRELLDQQRREAEARKAEAGAESRLLQQIAPMAAQLKAMQERVVTIEEQRAKQAGELAEQIRATQESARHSREAAASLAGALRNNQVRGGWGETQLRTLVESAGLTNRVDFHEQVTSVNEDGTTIKPDMIIRLPGGKFLAVDSKVPYNAFMDAQRESIDPETRAALLADHAQAVRGHVRALAARKYPTSPDGASLDFTIAYIPSDPILDAALKADPSLMEDSFRHGVVLASPASAWAILKTVAFTWRQDVLTNEARELFDLGKELYGRIITMANHVESMGKTLNSTVNHYNKFVSSLQRNVLTSAQRFERLDESKVFPAVPELDAQPDALTKGVLVAQLTEVAEQRAGSEFAALDDLQRPELDLGLAFEAVDGEIVDDTDADAV